MLGVDAVVALIGGALYGLWFRTVPFAAYALVARRVRPAGKLLALCAILALYMACARIRLYGDHRRLLFDALVSWGYMLLASLLVHAAVPPLRVRGCTSSALLLASGMLFLGLPGLLIHSPATLVTLAVGFESMFRAHSYLFEQTRASQRASLSEALTFLLVNPTLVYPARGIDRGYAKWSARGGGRVLIGLLGSLIAPFASALVSVASPWVMASAVTSWPGGFVATSSSVLAIQLFAQYIGHSSVASYQIGTMRLLGYELPERYNYPFLARTPDELWRRWNIYLGTWLLRYAYLPLAMRYQRSLPRAWWNLGKGIALVCVFGVCGLAHEAAGYALRFSLPMGAALGFVFYGLALTVWLAFGQLRRKIEQRRSWMRSRPLRAVNGALALAASGATLLAFGSVALPALAGFGLTGPIARWVTP